MVSYEVDPAILAPLVPRGTELDLHEGRALASMVGFRFLETRLRGVAIPLHRDFDEVNLRFYVRRETADGARRGTVFVKEIVPRPAIALVARLTYDEPYVAVAMRHRIEGDRRLFEWRRGGRWERLAARTTGAAALPAPESEEAFVSEHYWGYTRRRSGATSEYRVRHPQWTIAPAADVEFAADVATLYGERFVRALAAPPSSAFVATGSAVSIDPGGAI